MINDHITDYKAIINDFIIILGYIIFVLIVRIRSDNLTRIFIMTKTLNHFLFKFEYCDISFFHV